MPRRKVIARYDWIHPSWRDVVIEHLMKRPAERRRFLSRCGMTGVELALSVSGGTAGERERPLLRSDEDWLALRRHVIALVPEMSPRDHHVLLAAIQVWLGPDGQRAARRQVTELARELMPAIRDVWDEHPRRRIDVEALQLFYETSVLVKPLCPGPQLDGSWKAYVDSLGKEWGSNSPSNVELGLRFLGLVQANEPRVLRQYGWPSRYMERLDSLIDAAREMLDEAQDLVGRMSDPDEIVERSDADDYSYTTYVWARIASSLASLGVIPEVTSELSSEFRQAESEIDEWIVDQDEAAAERSVEYRDDDDYFDSDEGAEPPGESPVFSIEAIFSDL